MNCKATFSVAALAAAAYVVTLGSGWSGTVAVPSHVDGGTESDVPATVNEAGFDRPATSGHPEDGGDSVAFGGPLASDATAQRSSVDSGDNAPAAVGSIADSDASPWSRLLVIFGDLRAQIFGAP